MSKIYVKELDTKDRVGDGLKRIFTFDLDDNKKFCYRSRTSFNAYFRSVKNHNWKPDGYLYVTEHDIEYDINLKSWTKALGYNPHENIELIELPNIWEFYKAIKYNYKTKKYSKVINDF